MLNEDCVKDIMLAIYGKATYKDNGNFKQIRMKDIFNDIYHSGMCDMGVAYEAYNYIWKSGYIEVRKNPAVKARVPGGMSAPAGYPSPRNQYVIGITPAGFKFIQTIENVSLWEKIKSSHCLDALRVAIASGKVISDIASLIGNGVK